MAKKKEIKKIVKLQINAGAANPAPPIGTALWPTGIQIADFCKQFNDKTRDKSGWTLPTVITIYDDRSFSFITREPPMTNLIKKAIGLESGSATSHKVKVGKLTKAQIKDIATRKMPDLNANDVEAAMMIVRGSARSMGVECE